MTRGALDLHRPVQRGVPALDSASVVAPTERRLPGWILATAHKLVRVIHAGLHDRPYTDPGIDDERLVVERHAPRWIRSSAPSEAIGRAAAGGDSDRSRSVPVPRRRPSQGPRTASDPGRDPSRPHAGAARHAGARTALPAPRASGRREDPRREGHHPGAQRDVGDGTACGYSRSTTGGAGFFAAVEHWNAECVGWHVCKVGSRFAALDPIAQGLERLYGSLDADVARGLALRMDHGSQYLSDHFLKQIRYWGIHPSFGFVEEPETNGVAERWNRTLKEQAIHGRIFQNLEAVRAAVADFVERYNQTWRLEKLGYHTPIEAREEYELRQAA